MGAVVFAFLARGSSSDSSSSSSSSSSSPSSSPADEPARRLLFADAGADVATAEAAFVVVFPAALAADGRFAGGRPGLPLAAAAGGVAAVAALPPFTGVLLFLVAFFFSCRTNGAYCNSRSNAEHEEILTSLKSLSTSLSSSSSSSVSETFFLRPADAGGRPRPRPVGAAIGFFFLGGA